MARAEAAMQGAFLSGNLKWVELSVTEDLGDETLLLLPITARGYGKHSYSRAKKQLGIRISKYRLV